MAAVALVVGPARAWIRDALAPAPRVHEAPQTAPAQEAIMATTSFRPTAETVAVRLGPDGGAVRIRIEAVDGDRVEVWSPWDDLEITVLPEGVELVGLDGRVGLLRLGLPRSVHRVAVRMANGERRVIPVDRAALPRTTGPGGGASGPGAGGS